MMQPISDHVPEGELEQYCLGGLNDARSNCLEEHLLLCEACRVRLTETEEFLAAMREAGGQVRAQERGKSATGVVAGHAGGGSWLRQVAPVVLAAVLAVSGAVWYSQRSGAPAPAAFAVELTAVRGAASGQAPAGRSLLLKLDLTGLNDGQPFAGEVVDAAGNRVARFPVNDPRLKAFAAGSYFVRIYTSSGSLLREYALTVK